MKTKTVAFVLHKSVEEFYETAKKLRRLFSRLIEEENAETFLFAGQSFFDYFCCEILTDLKRYYPLINRVYIRQLQDKMSDYDKMSLSHNFDKVFIPIIIQNKNLYKSRYIAMIDKCDILVTYYDKDYKLLKGKAAATKNAVEYALKANKRIINLADELK